MSKAFKFSAVKCDERLDVMVGELANNKNKKRPVKKPQKVAAAGVTKKNVGSAGAAKDKNVIQENVEEKKKIDVSKRMEEDSLLAMAFGYDGPQKKPTVVAAAKKPAAQPESQKKSKKKNLENGNEEKDANLAEWKSINEKSIEEFNKQELKQAILESKLEYAENSAIASKLQRKKEEAAIAAAAAAAAVKNNKKKKTITLSLTEFNKLNNGVTEPVRNGSLDKTPKKKTIISDAIQNENFFEEVEQEVQISIEKDAKQKKKKSNKVSSNGLPNKVTNSPSGMTLVPIQELEKRDFEIQALNLEVINLKQQLEAARNKNKKLSQALNSAETKSVNEVLKELERVAKSRDEFSSEVTALSEQLEQEKTKVSQLQDKIRGSSGASKK